MTLEERLNAQDERLRAQEKVLEAQELRLKSQDRAIRLMAYYWTMSDSGFPVYVHEKVKDWIDTSIRSPTLTEEEKKHENGIQADVLRLLTPARSQV